MAKATKKAESLKHWQALEPHQNPLALMTPIPYKTTGSRYGACGIRIDGNPAFIDAVLSNIKSLIDGENHCTRLELSRSPVDRGAFGKSFDNADTGAECCYVRLHVRGREGAMASAVFDRHLSEPTRRFAELVGIAIHEPATSTRERMEMVSSIVGY
jgi:hypothetical protein